MRVRERIREIRNEGDIEREKKRGEERERAREEYLSCRGVSAAPAV